MTIVEAADSAVRCPQIVQIVIEAMVVEEDETCPECDGSASLTFEPRPP